MKYKIPIKTVPICLTIPTFCVFKNICLILWNFPSFWQTPQITFYPRELWRGCRDFFSPPWALETTYCLQKMELSPLSAAKGISHFFLRAASLTYFPSFTLESGAFACETGWKQFMWHFKKVENESASPFPPSLPFLCPPFSLLFDSLHVGKEYYSSREAN